MPTKAQYGILEQFATVTSLCQSVGMRSVLRDPTTLLKDKSASSSAEVKYSVNVSSASSASVRPAGPPRISFLALTLLPSSDVFHFGRIEVNLPVELTTDFGVDAKAIVFGYLMSVLKHFRSWAWGFVSRCFGIARK